MENELNHVQLWNLLLLLPLLLGRGGRPHAHRDGGLREPGEKYDKGKLVNYTAKKVGKLYFS